MVELFRRALTTTETCGQLADWLNRQGFTTRNRKKTATEEQAGEQGKPRKFTADSVRGILTNLFYAGYVVRQHRSKKGTPSASPDLRRGGHVTAVSEEDFNRVQSILRARYKAPRSNSRKLRPYLAKDVLRCFFCGEKAWCHHLKGISCYQESGAQRGIHCEAAGRYWPTPIIDDQIERIIRPIELPTEWKERALEIACAENNLLGLDRYRRSLEGRHRRVVELYKDGIIDRVEFERETKIIQNTLLTVAPVDVKLAEIAVEDFDRFQEIWDAATPEERSEMLRRMTEGLYVDFRTGQLLEVVPRAGFRYVFEGAKLTAPPDDLGGTMNRVLTIGDPDGIRTHDLQLDKLAC